MSFDELDRTLVSLEAEAPRLATALVELDGHPGQRILRGNTTLTGVTGKRWERAAPRLDALWADYALYQDRLEEARRLRDSMSLLTWTQHAELYRLLNGSPDDPAAGEGDQVPLSTLAERMNAALTELSELVAAVDASWSALIERLVPVETAWQEVSGLADGLGGVDGPVATAFEAARGQVASLREQVFSDPLGLRAALNGGDTRLDALVTEVAALRERLADLTALRTDFDSRLGALVERLELLADAVAEGRRVRERVAARITSPALPEVTDPVPELRSRWAKLSALAEASGDGRWQRRADALAVLEADTAAALAEVARTTGLLTGLLDRRAELRGRLGAYRAMAAGLGRAEDAGLTAQYREAHDLLWNAPCDLAAATRALARYQRAIREAT
jgi:hypothetical protein